MGTAGRRPAAHGRARAMFAVLRRPSIVLNKMSSPSSLMKITDICADSSALTVASTGRWGPLAICLTARRVRSAGIPFVRGSA